MARSFGWLKIASAISALVLLAGCSAIVSADALRKIPASQITEIEASKSKVADCLADKLKTTSYEVVRGENWVALQYGSLVMRLFDLEESAQGTLITMYVRSAFHVTQSKTMLDECQVQLERSKQ